jgi:hypothetical protein
MGVVAWVILGHATLIAPEHMHLVPMDAVAVWLGGQDFEHAPGSLTTRHGHAETTANQARLARLDSKKFGSSLAENSLSL